jgi:hypothetical protein
VTHLRATARMRAHFSLLLANALPECDFRYLSNSNALYLSENAEYQINSHGMNLAVCADLPAL